MKIKAIIATLKLGRAIMSEVGDANQARIAAQHANEKAPNGTILVVPAKTPVASTVTSMASMTAAIIPASMFSAALYAWFPNTDRAILELVAAIAYGLTNCIFIYLRHSYVNANTPGVQSDGLLQGAREVDGPSE